MKKIKNLLFILAVMVLLPIHVSAAEKINVYIFKGETCGFCAKALSFFGSLDEEYQSYFNLIEKEVWYDKNNAALMQDVADYFDIEVKGVPLIVIGEKTFQGYSTEFDDEIKEAIKTAYENTDGSYKDVVAPILNGENIDNSSGAAITIVIILLVGAGIGFLIYMAKDNAVLEEEETKVVEEKKEAPIHKSTTKKVTASLKKSTTKKVESSATSKKVSTVQNATKKKTSTNKNKAKN